MPFVEIRNSSGQQTAINTDAVAYIADNSSYVAVYFIGAKDYVLSVPGPYAQVAAKLKG